MRNEGHLIFYKTFLLIKCEVKVKKLSTIAFFVILDVTVYPALVKDPLKTT